MTNKALMWIFGISGLSIIIIGGLVFILLYQAQVQRETARVETQDAAAVSTQIAETVWAELTRQAAELTPVETNTSEPAATETLTTAPTSTATPVVVGPTNTAPTAATPTPLACDRVEFVRDVSVEDNTPFAARSAFVKTWRLKNAGSCTWTTKYSLVFVSGDVLGAEKIIPLPKNVGPGQTIDISAAMKAPKELGTYRGFWMLKNTAGARFGMGSKGDEAFWVKIRVVKMGNPGLAYDFAANYCQAKWSSDAGSIPCPGTRSATEGFILILDTPKLENHREDEWTLWTHPNNQSSGWISGVYPEFVIQPGHHFVARVGCLDESEGCNVNFRLDFKNVDNGVIRNLGSWREVYDGKITKIDIDLSKHAGKHVRFILTVEVKGGTPARANAFWFVPGIKLVPPVPTATPTEALPTETPTPTQEPPTETPTATLGTFLVETPTPTDSLFKDYPPQ